MQSKSDPTGHSFSAYFKRATSPLVVLKLLAEKSMYGYELSQEMKRRSGGDFTISVLYPVLYRLEEQGYLYVSESRVVDGRARSYYAVTEAGQAYLKETMADYEHISGVFAALMKGADSNGA